MILNYGRKTKKHLEEIMDWLARFIAGMARPDGLLDNHIFVLVDG